MVRDWLIQAYTQAIAASPNPSHFPTFEQWNDRKGSSANEDSVPRFATWRIHIERTLKLDRDESDYGLLFSYFRQSPAERQALIERLTRDAMPGFGYLYLAGLIASARVNRVLTTNFDDLLSDALIHYYEERPVVYSFDSAVAGARMAGKRPKIIKLHGDFLYDNIKNVRNEVQALESNMERKLYEACKGAGLVVIGYGGNDESIMAPLRDMLRKSEYLKYGLHWCLHLDHASKLPSISKALSQLASSHRSNVHLYIVTSFDEAMEAIFRECKCDHPNALMRPHERSLTMRFYNSVVLKSGVHISDGMHADMDLFVKQFGQAVDTADYDVREAEWSWWSGVKARDRNDYAAADAYFDQGISRFTSLLDCDTGTPLEVFQKRASGKTIMQALRRYCGLRIAKAKVFERRATESGQKEKSAMMSMAVKQVELAIATARNAGGVLDGIESGKIGRSRLEPVARLIERELGQGMSADRDDTLMLYRSPFYNGICAYGVLCRLRGRLTKRQWSEVEAWQNKFVALDPTGEHLNKLHGDSDFKSLVPP